MTAQLATPTDEPDLHDGPIGSRLTVRELQRALADARGQASSAGPAQTLSTSDLPAAAGRRSEDQWLPDHDGPVSLSGTRAPHARQRRAHVSPLDRTAPRGTRRTTRAALKPATAVARARERLRGFAPLRVVLLPASGGGGCSTLTVLLASAIAPVCQALIVGPPDDAGVLGMRADAIGCDWDELDAELAKLSATLTSGTSGLGRADTGESTLMVAATSRQVPPHACTAKRILPAALRSSAAVFIDCPDLTSPFTSQALADATHVLIVAPQTAVGLLGAEFAVDVAQRDSAPDTPFGVVSVDVRGGGKSRSTRAALSRAHALPAPVRHVPFDPHLADAARARWTAIRPRTQATIAALLTEVLIGKGDRRAA